jgi:outer membrane protein
MSHFIPLKRLALAATVAFALAPAAFAQDADNDTDSGKRFSVVAGYAHMVPKSDPGTILGSDADLDGQGAPTLSGSWHVNENIAVELWGAGKVKTDVDLADGGRGAIKTQPVALSGQYHFGDSGQAIRPYVGLGYYQANVDSEDFDASVAGPNHVGIGTPKGAIGTVGADFNITDRWFARADARYMKGDAEVKVAGEETGEELQLDPWMVGVGVGVRF